MDQLRLDGVLKELERVAQIAFKRGSSEQIEQLLDKLEMLNEDAMLYYRERRKEESE